MIMGLSAPRALSTWLSGCVVGSRASRPSVRDRGVVLHGILKMCVTIACCVSPGFDLKNEPIYLPTYLATYLFSSS